MQWSDLLMNHLDWRRPWLWPKPAQYAWFGTAGLMGVALLSPWWLHSWQAWEDAQEAQAQLLGQQANTQALLAKTAQWLQTESQATPAFADAATLTRLAHEHGLQLSPLSLDQPQLNPTLHALHMQQVPVHLKVHGSWDGWLNWLARWPAQAPGVTVSALELTANASGGIVAQVLVVTPQSTATDVAFELASVDLANAAFVDPFSPQAWVQTQRAHAEQQPSYARLIAPELLRAREVLEAYPRERLQYVGQIASKEAVEALVKVLPSVVATKEAPMMSVHRVRVGSRLGQDFGKVLAVHADQLVLEELALNPAGEWRTREVRMPLHEATP
jgi:Tfp pilus assembly protein PilP